MDNASRILRLYEHLTTSRAQWDSSFAEIAASIYPRKGSFNGGIVGGEKVQQRTWDGTAQRAASMLAAAVHTMMCPMTQSWFDLDVDDNSISEDWRVKVWKQQAARITADIITESNFHSQFHEHLLDFFVFGNAVMLMESDPDHTMQYSNRALSECMFSENHRGYVDIVARVFEYSARQMVQKFSVVSDAVRKLAQDERGESQKFKVLHLVKPIDNNSSSYLNFESFYVDVQHRIVMEQGHFREFPYVVSRFERASGETYGRGPGWHALPEAQQLNILQRHTVRGVQKATDPAIMVPERLFAAPLNLGPSKINYYRRTGSTNVQHDIAAFPVGARIEIAEKKIELLQDAINKAFYVDQLNLPMLDRMTATEVTERMISKNYVLSPILGQMNVDTVGRIVKRAYYEGVRVGRIAPPPQSMMGRGVLKIKWTSPLSRIMRLNELRGFQQGFSALAPIIQAKPEMLNAIDENELLRWTMDVVGGPLQIVKSPEQYRQEQMQRAKSEQEAAQAQMQGQALQGLSGSIKDVAQAGKFASEAMNMGVAQ